MKSELETLHDLFGKNTVFFTADDAAKAMRVYANQFRWIKTTCGKKIEFDDLDYEVLRQQALFFDSRRKSVCALYFTKEGKRVVAPVAKLLVGAEGRSIIHYRNKNPLNLRRDNIELIDHQKAHYKQKKQRTSSGNITSSIYKGVSWSTFAGKWCAYIKIDGAKKHLGYFLIEGDAAKAYNKAAIENWGQEYSELNIII
mgnify:CR=1 FL=1